jgi:type IV secretory pathway TrbD component
MFLVALFLVTVLSLLVANWQITLLGLGIWMLVRALAAKYPGSRAAPGPGVASRELPATAYLPRWTATRRLNARREHAQWQDWFDASR